MKTLMYISFKLSISLSNKSTIYSHKINVSVKLQVLIYKYRLSNKSIIYSQN